MQWGVGDRRGGSRDLMGGGMSVGRAVTDLVTMLMPFLLFACIHQQEPVREIFSIECFKVNAYV